MPWYEVNLHKDVAYDAVVRVEASSEIEATELALKAVTRDDFEEGDWESEVYAGEVLEVDEQEDDDAV